MKIYVMGPEVSLEELQEDVIAARQKGYSGNSLSLPKLFKHLSTS